MSTVLNRVAFGVTVLRRHIGVTVVDFNKDETDAFANAFFYSGEYMEYGGSPFTYEA